jgi:hypothetical protein
VVPQYVSSNKKCYVAMAKYWTSDEFKKKHEEGQIYRALMDSASHVQGSLPLEVARRREVSTTILCFLLSAVFFTPHAPFTYQNAISFAGQKDRRGSQLLLVLANNAYKEKALSYNRVDVGE